MATDFRDTLKTEIEKARRAMAEAKTKHDTLVAMLAKYDESHNGHRTTTQAEPRSEAPSEAPNSIYIPDIQGVAEEADNKAAQVRAFIVQHQERGITSSEIIEVTT